MKKIFGCLMAVFFTACIVAAQETHWGVKAGLNISSVAIDNGDDYASKLGFHAGGLAHIHLNKNWALQPEAVFSMQGGKDDDDDDVKLKLNYVNIPLLVQYMTADGFRLQTGPQLGILVSAESKVGDIERDVNDDLSTVDFSWTFGAGYLFPSGLGIDARYNHGISNISDDETFEARNRVFQVGLFYQFMRGSGRR